LKQEIIFCARGYQLHKTKLIQRIIGPGVEPRETSKWSNELLPIPATVPSISTNCRVINVSYYLTVTLNIPGGFDLQVVIPVTIGNTPFQGTKPVTDITTEQTPQDSVPPPTGDSYTSPTDSSIVPIQNPHPPVEEKFNYSAINPPIDIADDQYTMGETQYAPLYGFVTNYQYAPTRSRSHAIEVLGPEDESKFYIC